MNQQATFGLLAFLLWSSFATWYYTCKIKGLCINEEAVSVLVSTKDQEPEAIINESESTPSDTVGYTPVRLTTQNILFEINSAKIVNPSAIENFILNALKEISGRKDISVTIVGHTCDLGTSQHNQILGQKRAESVQDYIDNLLLPTGSISYLSKGKSEPLVPNTDEKARAKNRRVEITIKSIEND